MGLLLGVDTGGTFTDAVLVDAASNEVVAKAKHPTTHDDLIVGIRGAMTAVVEQAGVQPVSIQLVSVSTTLATNAVVESVGTPSGLVSLGLSRTELERAGLDSALSSSDVVITLDGGHDAHGNELVALAEVEAAVRSELEQLGDDIAHIRGWAVAAQFAVRNPGHERAVAATLRELTGSPVTCSHELTSKLGGPRRAVTAMLNSQLIVLITEMVEAVRSSMTGLSLECPLMVVRGDGSLVRGDFARERPIETLLSGPAASVIGGLHLSGATSALVSDIGGTTTDVAAIVDGAPGLAPEGATVGGHRTMIEAVDMATVGLGGDSEVVPTPRGTHAFAVGPQRAVPLSRLARSHPELVHRHLDAALADPMTTASVLRIALLAGPAHARVAADSREEAVMERLAAGPLAESTAAPSSLASAALGRLRGRGIVRIATVTPTDAAHVLGLAAHEDPVAAEKAVTLLARQQDDGGAHLAPDASTMARMVIDRLVDDSATTVLGAAMRSDGLDDPLAAQSPVVRHQWNPRPARGLSRIDVGLDAPIVALGASAAAYYPGVASRLGTTAVIDEHADVANALGAAVAKVRVRRTVTVTQPTRGQFRVHHDDQPTFGSVERAQDHAQTALITEVEALSVRMGVANGETATSWAERSATIGGKRVFVEGTLTVEVAGDPAMA